ncbi:MAG: hypothetical protein SVM79_08480 [Chloroflexota bacterium]|nr:hypothetical protein [Chloroflexota bacterium]
MRHTYLADHGKYRRKPAEFRSPKSKGQQFISGRFDMKKVVIIGLLLALVSVMVGACGAEKVREAPPEVDASISDAELQDLQSIASQKGISLQAAIDRYAWNDNFALAVAKIREAAPAAFAGAEIVDAGHAWVAFAGRAPEAARDIIDTFSSSHSGVSVEVRADLGFTEVELERAIVAVHFAVLEATEVRDASTSFDSATGQIRTSVVLESTASDSVLDDLAAIAAKNLIDATRADILNSITTSVIRSNSPVTGGNESSTEHLGR